MPRKSKKLPTKENILIICEGYTEVHYLEHLNQNFNASNVKVEVHKSKKTNAIGIVQTAIDHPKRPISNKVFVFFDKDHNTKQNLEDAYRLAKQNNIKISYSNSSFDLWVLLHFKPVNSWILQPNICKNLSTYFNCNDYSKEYKNNDKIGDILFPRIYTAFNNIEKGPHFSKELFTAFELNPYSNINDSLEEIYNIANYKSRFK